MRYLVNVIDSRSNSGTAEEAVAIDAFNAKLRAGGHWVFAAGLADPTVSTVIDGREDEPILRTAPSSRRRSGRPASGSSTRPISTWRWRS